VAATSITVLMAGCAWLVVRTRLPGRAAVDVLASLPLAMPGLVVGVALLTLSSHVTVLFGSLVLLVLAFAVRFMPYGMRYAVAAMQRVSSEQEEAAQVSGAGWGQTFRRVVLPLIGPGLAAGWLYVLALCVRELSSVVVLVAPGTQLVSVRIFADYQNGQFADLAALGLVVAALLAAATGAAWRLGRGSLVR
jgi:iron(III) transport system permease protein